MSNLNRFILLLMPWLGPLACSDSSDTRSPEAANKNAGLAQNTSMISTAPLEGAVIVPE